MTRQNSSVGAETVMLLVGGGHAHVAVLADWAKRGAPAGVRGVLLTPERYLRYSGMVPGWIAGQHAQDDGLVDLGCAGGARRRRACAGSLHWPRPGGAGGAHRRG